MSASLGRACVFAAGLSCARLAPKGSEKSISWQGIDHVLLLQPTAARHGDAVANECQYGTAMLNRPRLAERVDLPVVAT